MTCRIVEEYGDERVAEARDKIAEKILRDDRMSVEDIVGFTEVPLERVKQMAERLAAPVQA